MDNAPRCDIIMPIFNRLNLTRNCLESIRLHTHSLYNMILVDNGSDAETKNFLDDFKSSNENVLLVHNQNNLGWVRAVNRGLELSTSPYICLMNNDTVVRTDDWLFRLIEIANSDPAIGLVNPRFETKARAVIDGPFIEIDFCRGYCMLIKRQVVEKIGLLDESYGLGYYDDDDYSVRAIRAGFKCIMANDVLVEHIGDSTFSALFQKDARAALHDKNKMLFYSRWGRRLRLVFIITGESDRNTLSGILFSLARRQHIIDLWNLTRPLSLSHINIREKAFPARFHTLIFSLNLFLNSLKRRSKRYDIIFIDSPRQNSVLSRAGRHTYRVDIGSDADRIYEIVDSASRVKYEV